MEFIGYIAGICTTISLLPQLLHIYKIKSAKDISLGMYIIFCLGVFLWTIYGLITATYPLMIFSFCSLVLALAILGMKIVFDYRYKTAQ